MTPDCEHNPCNESSHLAFNESLGSHPCPRELSYVKTLEVSHKILKNPIYKKYIMHEQRHKDGLYCTPSLFSK